MKGAFKVTKITKDKKETVLDFVAKEIPLTIMLGNKHLVTFLCSPSSLDDFVIGFLFTSGLIKTTEDIKKITINDKKWIASVDLVNKNIPKNLFSKRIYTSGCGKGTIFCNELDLVNKFRVVSDFKIAQSKIIALMPNFHKKSETYLNTGGAHIAALVDDEEILFSMEDVGRHNSVDKVIGHALKRKIPLKNKIILSSGRISSDIMLKVQKAGIPILVSRSAPTDQAVMIAKEAGITLIGFARGSRMNIYNGAERIL